MLTKKFKSALAASTLLVGLAFAGSASSAVIFNGGEFDLSFTQEGDTPTYTVVYTADFTNWSGPDNQQFMAGLNFKPDTGAVPTTFSLTATTAGTVDDWAIDLSTLSANGCGGGAESFVCGEADPFNVAPTTTGQKFTWTFSLAYAAVLEESAFTNMPIRAWFVDGEGKNSGLMSETVNRVPEPATVGLLGLSLLGLAALRRRSLSKKS